MGSLRYFAVRTGYQGLCVGRRLLEKVQDKIFQEAQCCRVMSCLPDTRSLVMKWIGRRGFQLVRAIPYPYAALGHEPSADRTDVQLNQYTLINPLLALSTDASRLPQAEHKGSEGTTVREGKRVEEDEIVVD